jgi:hypothetical protein
MDLSKYVSLLHSAALFFSRVDCMDDPYEGAASHANRSFRPDFDARGVPQAVLDDLSPHRQWERQWTFINCWHMNEYESDAMWRLYARTTDAVAIQSTFSRLQEVLPSSAFLGVVQYIDYNTEWMPEGNAYYRFMHKRRSFEHERELRALIQATPLKPDPGGSAGQIFDYIENTKRGQEAPVELVQLIEKIYVAPTAASWFRDVVKSITAKYGINLPVLQSALDQKPEF